MFWLVLTLVVLAPLVAIWRNLSTLCLLYAQVATSGHPAEKKLRPVIEWVFKFVSGMSLYIWLSTLLPMEGRARWIVLATGAVAVIALLVLRRKLIYWHSELEVELKEVFSANEQMEPDLNAPWLRPHGDWNLSVMDCVLPDLADVQGRCIADLDLRARFGCTVVGVGRQGYMISLPSPDTVLYPRDKVLLLGTTRQVAEAKTFLLAVSGLPPAAAEFDDVRMEAMTVPGWSRAAGRDLKTLSPMQVFQVQIAGIRRGNTRTLSPAGRGGRWSSGDELLVLGMPDRIQAFRDWLEEGTDAGRAEIKLKG
jgi:CPA2 family monovalent cation:H+ antiporter-2